MTAAAPIPRHYGLDWLRIGAFAILILYHIGMVFVPWGFHVQLASLPWVAIPMLASNPWRLMLLFVVSGYATRALAVRHPTILSFARGRSIRLLVPLLFGVCVLVPPQIWAELASKYGYAASYWVFWARDWLSFRAIGGVVPTPAWNHLWFVGYLWVYTMAIALMLAVGHRWAGAAQRVFDRVLGSWGGAVLPVVGLLLIDIRFFPGQSETHALLGDWLAHAIYFPALLFGFGMAGSERVLDSFRRGWAVAGVIALASYAVAAGLEWRWPGLMGAPKGFGILFAGARAVQGWMAVVALIGIAERFWNRDHPWRRTLTEAVFPFYLIHQTIIILVAFALRGLGWPLWLDAVILIAATVAGCWVFYRIGREVKWLRPLIGLRPRGMAASLRSDRGAGDFPDNFGVSPMSPSWSLVIHGGAGRITRDVLTPEQDAGARAGLDAALKAGSAVLAEGGSALDAVEAAVRVLEDDPHFNAGRGACFTREGTNELDAAIMDGRDRRAGSVAGVTRTRNPVSLARKVMAASPHVLLAGPGADRFSAEQGLEQVDPAWFHTDERRRQLDELLSRNADAFDSDMKYGTVGAVACDCHGHVAAATSTGGVTGKRWGRIGDSPLIGAGTYADDRACAVSCTGSGEVFIRVGVGHEIAARRRFTGESIQAAADTVLAEVKALGGTGGTIVAAPDGTIAWSMTTAGMYRGRATSAGEHQVAIYADEG